MLTEAYLKAVQIHVVNVARIEKQLESIRKLKDWSITPEEEETLFREHRELVAHLQVEGDAWEEAGSKDKAFMARQRAEGWILSPHSAQYHSF